MIGFGRTSQGIPFGDSRGSLTDCFFLICSTDDPGHLKVLARLSRLMTQAVFLQSLRDAESAGDIHQAVRDGEGELH